MDRLRLLVTVLVILLLLIVIVYETEPIASSQADFTGFTINGRQYALTYLATNDKAIQKGLMDTKITANTTMLFVFPDKGQYTFWMYDVNSSLDIIWMSTTGNMGKVVYLVSSAPSCYASVLCQTYESVTGANMVLEAKAGFAEANGVTTGTTIVFN